MKYIVIDPLFWASILFIIHIINSKYYKKSFIYFISYVSFFIIIILSLPVIANSLVKSHELIVVSPSTNTCLTDDSDHIMIVLSGGLNDIDSNFVLARLQLSTYSRVLSAFEIYKQHSNKIKNIVIAGGIGSELKEADIIKKLFIDLGIEKDMLLIDINSINTYQNASNVSTLLMENSIASHQKLILVTSALHMKRAIYSFNRVGLNVCAYPVDSIYVKDSYWLPRLSALTKSTQVIQEIFSYWLYFILY